MLRPGVNANMSQLTIYDQITKNILTPSGNRSIKVYTPNGTAKKIQEHATSEIDKVSLCSFVASAAFILTVTVLSALTKRQTF